MTEITLRGHMLHVLPDLPPNIVKLWCDFNLLTELPNYLHELKLLRLLDCTKNELTQIPKLPESLKILHLGYNHLVALPRLPENIEIITCNNNELTELPLQLQELVSLETLIVDNNPLTSLPVLPKNLKRLNCENNNLTVLPALPESLSSLNCSNNNLTDLPSLPQRLRVLNCSDNNLTTLPPLPSTIDLQYFKCRGNNFNIETMNKIITLYENRIFETARPRIKLLMNLDKNALMNISQATFLTLTRETKELINEYKYFRQQRNATIRRLDLERLLSAVPRKIRRDEPQTQTPAQRVLGDPFFMEEKMKPFFVAGKKYRTRRSKKRNKKYTTKKRNKNKRKSKKY